MSSISTKTDRAALKPRREPYWYREQSGGHIGYRKLIEGVGTWVARYRHSTGERSYRSFGHIEDDKRAFDIAREKARNWFKELSAGAAPSARTVKQVCEEYVEKIRLDGGESKATQTHDRLKRLVYPDRLARVQLADLRREDFVSWRRRLSSRTAHTASKKSPDTGRKRSPATINRDMAPLRAALNLAYESGYVSSDFAWAVPLKEISNADGRREIYLEQSERRRLLDAADDEIKPFLRALMLLPMRPGATAKLTVADFDARQRTLRISVDKGHAERRIQLPEATATLFREQAKDKLPAAPIFARADGSAWKKTTWNPPIKRAVLASKLRPQTSAYTLRHSTITDLVTHTAVDLLTIARLAATSVRMIEQHYGHLRQEKAAAALASLVI